MSALDQWMLFIGRFHPVVLHLPIGAVILVALMEFIPLKSLRDQESTKRFLLVFAVVTALLAILTGLFLEQEGGYGAERIFWHKMLGILMTVFLVTGTYIYFRKGNEDGTRNWIYRICLMASVALLGAGAHHGGVMTHGSNHLTEHFPFKIVRKDASPENQFSVEAPPIAGEATLKHSPAGTLLQGYCFDCHNPDRKKGKLDLQSLMENDPGEHPETWKEVISMLEKKEMPPTDEPDLPRPSDSEYISALGWLTSNLSFEATAPATKSATAGLPVLDAYCTSCHSGPDPESDLDIAFLLSEPLHRNPDSWEAIIRKMHARQMPPHGKPHPDPETYEAVIHYLEDSLDFVAMAQPNPGRTSTFRRLTRAEYENAIRDLLAIELDASELLPRDEVSHGFDNITVTELTPTLMDRYISAARKIARMAVGSPVKYPEGNTIRVRPDLTQEDRMEGLPLGTRGGIMIPYHFPRTGTYEIQIRLTRDRNEKVEGLDKPHQLEVMVDRQLLQTFTVAPPVNGETYHKDVDKHLQVQAEIEAGYHEIGVTFPRGPEILLERRREPLESSFNFHRHPRLNPAIYEVSINGPFADFGPGETASREKIFGGIDREGLDPAELASRIIRRLARQAYRRPVTDEDVDTLLDFYHANEEEGFEAGIEAVLTALLVNPNFLFRIERDPQGLGPQEVYAVNDLELASRLSFFIWSSLPDEELIALAEAGQLSNPDILEAQALRMLKDPRASSMVEQFAAQWLYLRNIDSIAPNPRLFTDFDDNLRQAMRRETELLFEHVMREDKSVLELITADYTFLNERVARHYDIPGVYGPRFRKVQLDENSERGGLLRHGSILSVTSYANRTSPVIRGAWILENIVGAPPPPPPPDVPDLAETVISEHLPIRERLAAHRENPSCASCHEMMDPIGFALETYNAVGQRRFLENGMLIDASGVVADGTTFIGVSELEDYIMKHPENFVRTMVEKLLTFGLGRGIEYYDMPAVREIVHNARASDYAFSSLIIGITKSHPFQNRIVP